MDFWQALFFKLYCRDYFFLHKILFACLNINIARKNRLRYCNNCDFFSCNKTLPIVHYSFHFGDSLISNSLVLFGSSVRAHLQVDFRSILNTMQVSFVAIAIVFSTVFAAISDAGLSKFMCMVKIEWKPNCSLIEF